MRKLTSTLALGALTALTLTGCVPFFGDDACERPATSPELAELISVSGEVGTEPTISAFTPIRTASLRTYELIEGVGTVITDPEQLIITDLMLFRGQTGERLIGTPYDGDGSRVSNITHWANQLPGLGAALECAAEGSRILAVLSPDEIGETFQQGIGIADTESVIAVIDVRKVYLPRAQGSDVFNTGRGLPSVMRAPDGRPGIVVPSGPPPAELVTQVLIQGSGAAIASGDSFRVHYTGLTWAGRKVFDTSWGSIPAQFQLEMLVPGVAEALEGQRVGSQVMIVVPPELGYGDEARANIPAGSTLVFVFDILGIDPAPAG